MKNIKIGMIVQIAVYIVLTVSALFLMKLGEINIDVTGKDFTFGGSFYNVLGMVLYVCSFGLWMVIIQRYDLSFIYPIVQGLVYVLIFVVGILLFNEQVETKDFIAAFLILSGLVLINLK